MVVWLSRVNIAPLIITRVHSTLQLLLDMLQFIAVCKICCLVPVCLLRDHRSWRILVRIIQFLDQGKPAGGAYQIKNLHEYFLLTMCLVHQLDQGIECVINLFIGSQLTSWATLGVVVGLPPQPSLGGVKLHDCANTIEKITGRGVGCKVDVACHFVIDRNSGKNAQA